MTTEDDGLFVDLDIDVFDDGVDVRVFWSDQDRVDLKDPALTVRLDELVHDFVIGYLGGTFEGGTWIADDRITDIEDMGKDNCRMMAQAFRQLAQQLDDVVKKRDSMAAPSTSE